MLFKLLTGRLPIDPIGFLVLLWQWTKERISDSICHLQGRKSGQVFLFTGTSGSSTAFREGEHCKNVNVFFKRLIALGFRQAYFVLFVLLLRHLLFVLNLAFRCYNLTACDSKLCLEINKLLNNILAQEVPCFSSLFRLQKRPGALRNSFGFKTSRCNSSYIKLKVIH